MNTERMYKVLVGPHVSEKTAMGGDHNQVAFKVARDANKLEIKKAVEQLFKVSVVDVRTLNMKGKVKRNRFGLAKKPNWKKAYVTLEQGQEIDFAAVE